jgi:hypothetical protein
MSTILLPHMPQDRNNRSDTDYESVAKVEE